MGNRETALKNLSKVKQRGRKKGVKDKIPQTVKARVMAVWNKLETEKKSLHVVAKENPKWFYETFVKALLPKNLEVEGDLDTTLRVIYEEGRNGSGDQTPEAS